MKYSGHNLVLLVMGGCVVLFAVTAGAAIGSIDRHVIAGGGGTSTGGSLAIEGRAAEVSASDTMSGGSFTLHGGFWNTLQGTTTLANISTRLRVETGDNVLIGGFIVTGTQGKKVIVRAMGPSLPVAGALADPFFELHDGAGNLITSKWKTDNMLDVGFGAEDVAKIKPLLVTHNDKGEIEGVNYDRLSAVFVNAFKEQQAQIERQGRHIERQQQINALTTK